MYRQPASETSSFATGNPGLCRIAQLSRSYHRRWQEERYKHQNWKPVWDQNYLRLKNEPPPSPLPLEHSKRGMRGPWKWKDHQAPDPSQLTAPRDDRGQAADTSVCYSLTEALRASRGPLCLRGPWPHKQNWNGEWRVAMLGRKEMQLERRHASHLDGSPGCFNKPPLRHLVSLHQPWGGLLPSLLPPLRPLPPLNMGLSWLKPSFLL